MLRLGLNRKVLVKFEALVSFVGLLQLQPQVALIALKLLLIETSIQVRIF